MEDIVELKTDNSIVDNNVDADIIEISEDLLYNTNLDVVKSNSISVPIDKLSTLGAGVASIAPALRTVTETVTVNTEGLYQLANKATGDILKNAADGTKWAAFKTSSGGSKMVKLKEAGPISVTNTTKVPINPAMMMMAVALFSIEQKMDNILEMEKRIISFLENEKTSNVEGDVESLTEIIKKYKNNWDNEYFVSGNYKRVLDIQDRAIKNVKHFQKEVVALLEHGRLPVIKAKVDSKLNELQKAFKYYRLALYTYSLASFLEILLSGNFKEGNIADIKTLIENRANEYKALYTEASHVLEKVSNKTVEKNVLKGVGVTGKTMGQIVGKIPLIKEGHVDELLIKGGTALDEKSYELGRAAVENFADMHDPNTGMFVEKMEDMIQIYNHTDRICFDKEKIYLITE